MGNSHLQSELCERLQAAAFITAPDVADLLGRHGLTIEQLMVALLPIAAKLARPPVSNFHVGAVALGMPPPSSPPAPAALYLGANLEFAGLPLSMTVHAEQAAVNNAWLHNEPGLQAIAVTAAPCGYCRQFLNELSTASRLRVIVTSVRNGAASWRETSLSRLLPRPFGPATLGIKRRLMDGTVDHSESDASQDLKALASAAWTHSYAPYTNNRCGVALKRPDGLTVFGRTAECAAYNPSLTAMQSALSMLSLQSPPESDLEIAEAWLTESAARISQRALSEHLLAAVNPRVTLDGSSSLQ